MRTNHAIVRWAAVSMTDSHQLCVGRLPEVGDGLTVGLAMVWPSAGPPLHMFRGSILFALKSFFFGVLLGRSQASIRDVQLWFSCLKLYRKKQIRQNRIFLVDLGFKACNFEFINQPMTKFLFPFNLFISCLFLFLLFILVDLVYVSSKCLAFIVISFLLVALIHVRLNFLLQFMLISFGCQFRFSFRPFVFSSYLDVILDGLGCNQPFDG